MRKIVLLMQLQSCLVVFQFRKSWQRPSMDIEGQNHLVCSQKGRLVQGFNQLNFMVNGCKWHLYPDCPNAWSIPQNSHYICSLSGTVLQRPKKSRKTLQHATLHSLGNLKQNHWKPSWCVILIYLSWVFWCIGWIWGNKNRRNWHRKTVSVNWWHDIDEEVMPLSAGTPKQDFSHGPEDALEMIQKWLSDWLSKKGMTQSIHGHGIFTYIY